MLSRPRAVFSEERGVRPRAVFSEERGVRPRGPCSPRNEEYGSGPCSPRNEEYGPGPCSPRNEEYGPGALQPEVQKSKTPIGSRKENVNCQRNSPPGFTLPLLTRALAYSPRQAVISERSAIIYSCIDRRGSGGRWTCSRLTVSLFSADRSLIRSLPACLSTLEVNRI